ncbi:MAG: GNAT family N-acetyltransferase [Kiritimatiellia bacterium]
MKRFKESVLLLYNAPQSDAESERGILYEVAAVEAALEHLHVPFVKAGLQALTDLPALLISCPARVVINLVEGFPNRPEDANLVPGVCRAFGRSVTGNDLGALELALDKNVAKAVLVAAGVPVPAGGVVAPGRVLSEASFPAGTYIVKPLRSDGSEGIDARSVVAWPGPELTAAVRRVHDQFGQPALVETFCGTREFNVSLLQVADELRCMPVAEIAFKGFGPDRPRIVGYEAKWRPDSFEFTNTTRVLPAEVTAEQAERLCECARAAWQALGCRDYARVDLRMDEAGELTVIEVNPNPDVSPDAGFAMALKAGGVAYCDFVEILLNNALIRLGPEESAPAGTSAVPAHGYPIRRSEQADRDRVMEIIRETGFFRPDEIEIAREVLDDSLRDGPGGHYQSFVIEADGRVTGWVCCGPTPCTVGTWDVYWIAVDPDYQKRSLGKALLQHAESCIMERGGRISVLETSGKSDYLPTRGFYLKCGYEESAVLRDYYAPGDALVIYTRHLQA